MRSMVRFLRPTTFLGVLLASSRVYAAPVVLEGDVPTDGPDHFFVDFDVPAGIEEIEIKHDDLSEANVLDFGVNDPNGYRGWGGGTSEPTIIAKTGASRAYLAGPITPGTWRVVIGKAKVVASPAKYKLEIDQRGTQTIASTESLRRPYQAPAARKKETRYWAGDFHVHSKESTDAKPTIEENIALAKSRGLDFIMLSDHNTITQLDFYGPVQDKEPDFLLLPGVEYTTYAGHASAIGVTKFVEHKIGIDGNATIGAAADAIAAQGGILSINHPVIDVGDLCIGCKWEHDLDAKKVGGVEIGTLGLSNGGSLFSVQALAFWDRLLDNGSRAAAIGGSDDHRAGEKGGFLSSVVGSPTTLVRADELSVAAIIDAIKKGRTVVKLDGPDDPMAELELATKKDGEALGYPGDTLGVRSILVRVKVTKGQGNHLRLVKNGAPQDPVAIDADPFVYTTTIEPPASGEDRWRAEVLVDDKPRTVTSHVWLKLDASGPAADAPPAEDEGCSTSGNATSRPPTLLVAVALAAFAAMLRRRARA
jgi:uncharacterized protein (TIGR03382 family)